jgi:glucose/arabinose dehydrogenase
MQIINIRPLCSYLFTMLFVLLTIPLAQASVVLMDSNIVDAELVPPTSQLANITRLAWAPDTSGRLFITLKTGQVMIAVNGSVIATPFATFSPMAISTEGGLLGMAFDPAFLANHYVYFMYQPTTSTQRIVRYDASGDIGLNPTIIVDNLPNNNGDRDDECLAFGPDGNLYFSIGNLGDGSANGGMGLDLLYLSSKVSRIHPDGTPVPSNPFYNGSGQPNDYIFARGFTSPFMTLFQPKTATLLVCDVGDFYEQFFSVTSGTYAGGNNNENRQTAGMLSPIIAYHKLGLGQDTVVIATASRTSNIVTLTTAVPHWQHVGGQITLSGMPDASLNGATLFIKSILSPTSLTIAQVGTDIAEVSASGLLTVISFGNCTTGAAFWDSSSVPASYNGNLIYGDYISGNMVRAVFDGNNAVSEVVLLATGSTYHVAMAQGPDGALYYAGYANLGTIRRLSYVATSPTLAVTPLHLNLMQGATAVIQVCLTAQPTSTVTVQAVTTGDPSISLASGQTLTFTPGNYAVPQAVTVVATVNAAAATGGTVTLTGSGGTGSASVAVNAAQPAQGLVLSASNLVVAQGAQATFTVQLIAAPASPVIVTMSNTQGSPLITVASGSLTFTSSNFSTPQAVIISAAADPGQTNDLATITAVSAGMVPSTIAITSTVTPIAQSLILSANTLVFAQGARATFTVHLNQAPASPVVVTVANTQGSPLITVAPGTLTFNHSNFSIPQTMTVSAATDPGQTNDLATITAVATGIAPSSIAITSTVTPIAQSLILSASTLVFAQGARATFTVHLNQAPASPVVVTVANTQGSPLITVAPGTLTFSHSNFSIPQIVTVSAATDPGQTNDLATITAVATGIAPSSITITSTVTPIAQSLILSASTLVFAQGAHATFTVQLIAAPTSPVVVTVANTQGSPLITAAPGTLTFTSSTFSTPQTVTVSAASDPGQTNDQATITAVATGIAPSSIAITSTVSTATASDTTANTETTGHHCGNGLYAGILLCIFLNLSLRRRLSS